TSDGLPPAVERIVLIGYPTTCDPTIIQKDTTTHDETNYMVKVDAKMARVVCPEGFVLQFKNETNYIQVDSIICERDHVTYTDVD
ncbi:hypothetical protein PFISCL1PPCAC_11509, partial [Pristionchus fissidentatus]